MKKPNDQNIRAYLLRIKTLPWFEIVLTAAILSVGLYAALTDSQNFSWYWFTRDDAYYYFKVAQNISEGKGSTFDGINPTNGYHPLWMAVCIPIFALARFDLILPLRILLLVMSGLSVATAILLYRLIGRLFSPALGAFAALYWAFNFDLFKRLYQQGLETGLAAFFIVLLVYQLFQFEQSWKAGKANRKHIAILGVFAALVMFSRLDLVFLAGIAGIWIVFRGHPLRSLLPLDIVLSAVGVLLAFIARLPFREYYQHSDAAAAMIAFSLAVNILSAYALGLYQPSVLFAPRKLLPRLAAFSFAASALVGALMIAVSGMAQFGSFPRAVILWNMLFLFALFGGVRLIFFALSAERSNLPSDDHPIELIRQRWKGWLKDALLYYGIVFGALGVYMLWNKIAFGTFSPVSGQIKRWWGSLPGRVYGGSVQHELSLFGIDYFSDANAWHPVSTLLGGWAESLRYSLRLSESQTYLSLLALLGLLFFAVLLTNKQKAKLAIAALGIVPLLCGAFLQVFYYHTTGYSAFKEWYWITQPLLIVFVFSSLAGLLFERLAKTPSAQLVLWIIAVGFGLQTGIFYGRSIHYTMLHNRWEAGAPDNDLAAFLKAHTEPGSVIGTTGGGNAGYFLTDRIVVNMDGLINSYEYFQALKSKTAGEYLANIGMDYVLANEGFIERLPYGGQFNSYLEKTGKAYYNKELFYYRSPGNP